MARYIGPKSKIARKFQEPIYGADKVLERKKYAPGQHGQNKRRAKLSEYGVQLLEKQKAKYTYGILERQFRKIFAQASRRQGITGENLLQLLESRLDNVVYRLGIAPTRSAARQLVGHRHIVVNGRVVSIPSFQLRPGDIVEVREKSKYYSKLAAALTPMSKALSTESANQIAYDCIQIHGGTGFMHDFDAERYYRDARITNIYEGTTQLQVVAAIGGVMQRVLDNHINELFDRIKAEGLHARLKTLVRDMFEKQLAAVKFVAEKKDAEYQNLRARNLVENETFVLVSLLMLRDAQKDAKREALAERYILDAVHDFERNNQIILSNDLTTIDRHREVIDY